MAFYGDLAALLSALAGCVYMFVDQKFGKMVA
jgi:hypothetical protein